MASFDGNSKLGFMRFIQIYNAISVLLSLVALVFVSGRELHGAVESCIAFDMALNIVCMSEIVWLISRRKQHTRAIAIVMYAAIMVSSFVMLAITGAVNPYSVVSNAIASGWPILYFATSRRAKAVLVQPFDMRLRSKELASGSAATWNSRSADFWLRLLIYFFVFSVAGHWMEMGVQVLVVNGIFSGTVAKPDSLTWRDSLNPFFIYGIAVAFCGLVLYPAYLKLKQKMPHVWQAYLASFLLNMAFCVVAELILASFSTRTTMRGIAATNS